MRQDIDGALKGWEHKPSVLQARIVATRDGREVLQMRLDLGILQMELDDRPDGAKPHGFASYYEYLKSKSKAAKLAGKPFTLNDHQAQEADREFMQYYQRRICWLALGEYGRAVTDADHTLAFMDFVRDHSPSDSYTQAHEQYRGFVLFHRAQAEAAALAGDDDPEGAVNALRRGAESIRTYLRGQDDEDDGEENPMLAQLAVLENEIRERHGVKETLEEQLAQAVAQEDYEKAAQLRDTIRRQSDRRTEAPGGA
jgi:UvrB/uvrC motif